MLLTVPLAKGFVDPGVRVFRDLGRGQFLLGPAHPGTERLLATRICLGLGVRGWWLEVTARSLVVGCATSGIETPGFGLPSFSLPFRCFHNYCLGIALPRVSTVAPR